MEGEAGVGGSCGGEGDEGCEGEDGIEKCHDGVIMGLKGLLSRGSKHAV